VDSDTFVNLKALEFLHLHLESPFEHVSEIGNASCDINITNSLQICSLLRRLDVSYMAYFSVPDVRLYVANKVIINVTTNQHVVGMVRFISKVEELFASGFARSKWLLPVPYVVLFDIDLRLHWKHVTLQNNNLWYLDLNIHSNAFKNVRSLDISNNANEYISPTFFYNMSSIRNVSLANNVLYKMTEQRQMNLKSYSCI